MIVAQGFTEFCGSKQEHGNILKNCVIYQTILQRQKWEALCFAHFIVFSGRIPIKGKQTLTSNDRIFWTKIIINWCQTEWTMQKHVTYWNNNICETGGVHRCLSSCFKAITHTRYWWVSCFTTVQPWGTHKKTGTSHFFDLLQVLTAHS